MTVLTEEEVSEEETNDLLLNMRVKTIRVSEITNAIIVHEMKEKLKIVRKKRLKTKEAKTTAKQRSWLPGTW